ncbi:NAD(P)/FAD-dependent oxidoreductase, partial [bacterium]|nr:NAD(P)/FAD-dependent oxidoreductase [bacterium]
MKNRKSKIVIIGAGLTGLSTAYFSKNSTIILDKNEVPGGLCCSYSEDGFTFDYTGHLLHFNQ